VNELQRIDQCLTVSDIHFVVDSFLRFWRIIQNVSTFYLLLTKCKFPRVLWRDVFTFYNFCLVSFDVFISCV